MNTQKKRVLSGIQPSGNLTIGNYIGALRQWVEEQEHYECYFCIVDLHAITVPQDPTALREKTREVAALYIASGLDPEKVTIFIQSHVTAHAELGWILTCLSPLGWLYRMTQFKDKAAKQQQESVGAGLLNYPALMAADILLYQAHAVPVGDDQRQHLEFTRDLAQRFNSLYGETFVIPEVMVPKAGARIMGLDNPTAKMSKSEESEYHAVYMLDSPAQVKKKIMRAVTDSLAEIGFSDDPERAGVNNLLTIYQALSGQTGDEVMQQFAGRGYGDLKKAVVEQVNSHLEPLQARYNQLIHEAGYLDGILARGAEKAAEMAEHTLNTVKERIGFLPNRSRR
ncbi:MAG: tryptophan--tRNA ligase [Chloroflexi bacterium]|nr:tryptophan--tRNA ligase [Chloroflexota bacterium]MDL1882793.1 tryptophan--tRNA ligase [Anaerolineae bacterium CFX8]